MQLPNEFVIVFDPVTHGTQFLDVKGEPTRERQTLSMVFNKRQGAGRNGRDAAGTAAAVARKPHRPPRAAGAVDRRRSASPSARPARPFLTAKRLLTNQTFRDIYRTDTLDVDQRLKITSLTFLFTDLKGSTALYERVGDLVAYDLVRQHFRVLHEVVASEAGAVVKTIGDAVMATFPTPDRALAAALRMRDEMARINTERHSEDLLLKIGIHEGPCLAVTLNDQPGLFRPDREHGRTRAGPRLVARHLRDQVGGRESAVGEDPGEARACTRPCSTRRCAASPTRRWCTRSPERAALG